METVSIPGENKKLLPKKSQKIQAFFEIWISPFLSPLLSSLLPLPSLFLLSAARLILFRFLLAKPHAEVATDG